MLNTCAKSYKNQMKDVEFMLWEWIVSTVHH